MGFTGLEPESFRHSSRILLHGIGSYCFRTRQLIKGQEGYGFAIDVGPHSPIPGARAMQIASIPLAVAHYGELLALVARWPVTTDEWPSRWLIKTNEWSNTKPEAVRFADSSGGDFWFYLKRIP